MAKFAYRREDKNRFVKIYPYVRTPPTYVYVYDQFPGDSSVEAGKITFTNSDTETYSFTGGPYTSAPSVTVSTVDTLSNSNTNVTITISAISTTTATIKSSAKFSGEVHIHVVAI